MDVQLSTILFCHLAVHIAVDRVVAVVAQVGGRLTTEIPQLLLQFMKVKVKESAYQEFHLLPYGLP